MKNLYYEITTTKAATPLIATESLVQIQYDIQFINDNILYFCSNPEKMKEELENIKNTVNHEYKLKHRIRE